MTLSKENKKFASIVLRAHKELQYRHYEITNDDELNKNLDKLRQEL